MPSRFSLIPRLCLSLSMGGVTVQSRDADTWPFSRYSIWNLPIGDEARFSATSAFPPDYRPSNGYSVDPEPWVAFDPASPLRPVFTARWRPENFANPVTSPLGGPVATDLEVPVPDGWTVGAGDPDFVGITPNLSAAVGISPTQVREFNYFTRPEPTGAVHIVGRGLRGTLNLYGRGTPDTVANHGGHGGSMLSAKGGTLTIEDLLGAEPIRHAWKLTADLNAVGCLDERGQNAHIWPAVTHDGDDGDDATVGPREQFYGRMTRAPHHWYPGFDPIMASGSLLAIPSGVDVPSLGIKLEPIRKLAWAAQRFGIYVVDCAGAKPEWHQNLVCVEYGAVAALIAANPRYDPRPWGRLDSVWQRDLNKLMRALHVVENNGPRSIGGGGLPLYDLAPEFTDGGTDLIADNPNFAKAPGGTAEPGR